jgi:hypothetical protein
MMVMLQCWYLRTPYWYNHRSAAAIARMYPNDPLLKMVASGKQLWADDPDEYDHADEYVANLRKNWD